MAGWLSTFRLFPCETSLVLNMMIQYVWYSVSLFKVSTCFTNWKLKMTISANETQKNPGTHSGKH